MRHREERNTFATSQNGAAKEPTDEITASYLRERAISCGREAESARVRRDENLAPRIEPPTGAV